MDSETTCLIRGSSDNPSGSITTDDDRLSDEIRAGTQLTGGIEGIHVHVQDRTAVILTRTGTCGLRMDT
jgi:hypothetical protein